jgi:hypothetical protein
LRDLTKIRISVLRQNEWNAPPEEGNSTDEYAACRIQFSPCWRLERAPMKSIAPHVIFVPPLRLHRVLQRASEAAEMVHPEEPQYPENEPSMFPSPSETAGQSRLSRFLKPDHRALSATKMTTALEKRPKSRQAS